MQRCFQSSNSAEGLHFSAFHCLCRYIHPPILHSHQYIYIQESLFIFPLVHPFQPPLLPTSLHPFSFTPTHHLGPASVPVSAVPAPTTDGPACAGHGMVCCGHIRAGDRVAGCVVRSKRESSSSSPPPLPSLPPPPPPTEVSPGPRRGRRRSRDPGCRVHLPGTLPQRVAGCLVEIGKTF